MDATIKDFFNEVIAHRQKTSPAGKYLSQAEKELGQSKLSRLNALILSWMHKYYLCNDLNKKIGDKLYEEYSTYFDKCDTIKSIFSLDKDRMEWQSSLTDDARNEIAKYVFDNFKIKVKINIGRPTKK